MKIIGGKTFGGSEVTATGTSITIDGVVTNIDVGDQVSATGTSITINGSTTNLDGRTQAQVQAEIDSRVRKIALAANAGKLVRVSDDVPEAAVAGTEYYSPEQFGGMHGTVFCQVVAVPATVTTGSYVTLAAISGVSNLRPISWVGYAVVSGNNWLLGGTPYPSADGIYWRSNGSNLQYNAGSNWAGGMYGMIYYAK